MNAKRVLVVDDDPALAESLADGLETHGFQATFLSDPEKAAAAVASGGYDALVTDLRMPKHDGLDLLERARLAAKDAPVIVMTAYSGIESAVECIRRGAYHYLTKPFKTDELVLFLRRGLDEATLRQESRSLRRELRSSSALANVVGKTASMREVVELVRRVADANVPVLVLGETGTGKGLVARALHAESSRAEHPFVSVNCAALPEALLESELFGHVRGAFTGATSARTGLFAAADGGTIFLDEIGEMAPALQAKLLHVLETGCVRPVGDTRERQVDVRVVAATHRDLRARAADGTFREDLLYRLDVVSIELPALRYRRDDLPLLVEHFFAKMREKHPHGVAHRMSREAMDALFAYTWPGNVRELEHLIERLVLLARRHDVELGDLPKQVVAAEVHGQVGFGPKVIPMREMQRQYAAWALTECGGEKRATCDALEIDYKTLMRHLG
jgi:two-component system response regulator HydG